MSLEVSTNHFILENFVTASLLKIPPVTAAAHVHLSVIISRCSAVALCFLANIVRRKLLFVVSIT